MAIDWSRWLPPAPLPNQGPLKRKVGQVWAWRADNSRNDPIVYRVVSRSDTVEVLARPMFPDCERCCMGVGTADGEDDTGGCAVLVADVGQEPAPPWKLYGGKAEGSPAQEQLLLFAGMSMFQTLLEE